jgi:hypothetical protein
VAVFDEQVAVAHHGQHGLDELLNCASQNRILASSSPTQPTSGATIALHPDSKLFEAALHFARNVQLSKSNSASGALSAPPFLLTRLSLFEV